MGELQRHRLQCFILPHSQTSERGRGSEVGPVCLFEPPGKDDQGPFVTLAVLKPCAVSKEIWYRLCQVWRINIRSEILIVVQLDIPGLR